MQLAVGINDGPYRLRGASDATWPSQAYGQKRAGSVRRRIAIALRATVRMVCPILALTAALGALYLYMDTPVPYLEHTGEAWLSVGHLLLPLAFLAIHLTNRRYGPAYALAQIALSLAVLGAAVLFGNDVAHRLLPPALVPGLREAVAFVAAFMFAGFMSIVAFDGSRGPRWWTAPLVGSIVAALVFVPIYYPAAYFGTPVPWFDYMTVEAGVLCGGAVLTLIPFWLLRRMVQPLPGFGGY